MKKFFKNYLNNMLILYFWKLGNCQISLHLQTKNNLIKSRPSLLRIVEKDGTQKDYTTSKQGQG